jgi:hypothetical protein
LNLPPAQHLFVLIIAAALLVGCGRSEKATQTEQPTRREASERSETQISPAPDALADSAKPITATAQTRSMPIVAAARDQIGKTTIYDGAYVGLDYPGGDVPLERGVCTDVVIRALRDAYDMDL